MERWERTRSKIVHVLWGERWNWRLDCGEEQADLSNVWACVATEGMLGSMALLQLGSVMMFVARVTTKGNPDAYGQDWNLKPCGYPRAVLS